METQSRLLFVLAALLLALVAVIALVEPPDDDDATTAVDGRSWEPMLPGRDPASVERLTLDLGSERRVFIRGESGWRIEQPLHAAADADAVDALVASFTSTEVDTEALDGPAAEYGVDDPTAVASLEFTDGSTSTVIIGRDAPTGGHSYVQVGADGPVQATRTRLSAGLADDLADYRDRRVWSLAWDDVDFVRLDSPRAAVELRRHDNAWWVRAALAGPTDLPPVVEGEERKAADALVDQALASLRRLKVDSFADDIEVGASAAGGADGSTDGAALPWRIRVRSAGVTHELRLAQLDDGWLAQAPAQEGMVRLAAGWEDNWLLPVPQWWAKEIEPALPPGDAPPPSSDSGEPAPAASPPSLPTP